MCMKGTVPSKVDVWGCTTLFWLFYRTQNIHNFCMICHSNVVSTLLHFTVNRNSVEDAATYKTTTSTDQSSSNYPLYHTYISEANQISMSVSIHPSSHIHSLVHASISNYVQQTKSPAISGELLIVICGVLCAVIALAGILLILVAFLLRYRRYIIHYDTFANNFGTAINDYCKHIHRRNKMGKRKKGASQGLFSSQEYEFNVSIRGAEVEGEMEEFNMRENTSLSYTLATPVQETDIMVQNEESQNERQVEDTSEDDSEHSYTFSSFGNHNFQPHILESVHVISQLV